MKSNVIYFGGGGKYQKEYEQLFDELVPMCGNADTVCGEVLRCASNIYYENYNNGNCNVMSGDGGMCDKYAEAIDNLRVFFNMRQNHDAVKAVKKIQEIYIREEDYNSANDEVFESLIDYTVEEILKERSK